MLGATGSSNPLVSTGDTGSGNITDDRSGTPGDNPNVDADTPASVVISDATSVEEAAGNYLVYDVSLSNAVASNTTITLSLGGDATSGVDYDTLGGAVAVLLLVAAVILTVGAVRVRRTDYALKD